MVHVYLYLGSGGGGGDDGGDIVLARTESDGDFVSLPDLVDADPESSYSSTGIAIPEYSSTMVTSICSPALLCVCSMQFLA